MRRPQILRAAGAAVALLTLLGAGTGRAQSGGIPVDSSAWLLEEVPAAIEASGEEGVADPEESLAYLADLRANPLDLNTATAEELMSVPGLTSVVAGAIIADRVLSGAFQSVAQVRRVSLVTPAVLVAMRPYVTVIDPAEQPRLRTVLRDVRLSLTGRVARRLELASGYRGDDTIGLYRGSPLRVLTRIRASSGRAFVASMTLEKDAGEAFADNRLGYDHVSGTAALMRPGPVRALVLGDFVADFGQGLALGRAGGIGKSADATRSPLRAGRGLRPFTSGGETAYFRGAGVTLAPLTFVEVSAFGSRRRLDATIDAASGAATSVGGDGLHRTTRELARRGALGESLVGAAADVRLAGRRGDGRMGIVAYGSRLDLPLVPPARPDTRFVPAGREASVLAVHADGRTGPFHAFAEAARAGRVTAVIAGAGAAAAPGSEILVVARLYPHDFASRHGSAFAERSGSIGNERGLYLGARTAAPGGWMLSGFLDTYHFPWLRFNVPRPSAGREALLRVDYEPRRWIRLHAQFRAESRDAAAESRTAGGSAVGALAREARRARRLHVEFDASRSVRLRTRFEATRAVKDGAPYSGVLTFQDVRYTVARALRIDARLAFFEADDFSARLYQLEGDVAGAFSLPALHGRGTRAYAMVTLLPAAGLTVQMKIAATFLEDVVRQGSGADMIDGHRNSEATVQARWQF